MRTDPLTKGERSFKRANIISKIFFITFDTLLILYGATFLYLVFWCLTNSVKDSFYAAYYPFRLPDKLFFSNFSYAWSKISITQWNGILQKNVIYTYWNMFFYSVCFSVGMTVMSIFTPFLAAYILARYKFPGRNFLFSMAIFIMVLPSMASLASSLYIRKQLGIYDNMLLHVITAYGGFEGNFLLLYGVAKGLSGDYAEAAKMDGAGNHTIMYRIFLPMMLPTMGALFVIGFLGSWNDYMTIITYLPSTPNLAYGVYLFKENATVNQISLPIMLSAYLIIALPTIIVWTCSQKLIRGMAVVGGLKG